MNRSLADQTGFTSLKVPYEKPPSQYRPTLPHTRPQSEDPGLQGKRLTRLSCDAVTMAVALHCSLRMLVMSNPAHWVAGRCRLRFLARLSLRVAARSTSLMQMRRCLSSGST